jgi:alanyl-tRNA synthetase
MAASRLYYEDSQLASFSATVTDIRELSREGGQSLWQVALDRTAFYPTSGGQPFDRGTLQATSRSGAGLVAEIEEVSEDDDGEVWHHTRKPLLAGTEVTGVIDWPRRLDHMQQHSGQHLLSAICACELGAATVGFHLGEQVSTVDLAVEDSAAQQRLLEALPRMEQLANEWIASNATVQVRTVGTGEAQALLAAGALRKLPERQGPIRLIEMPGIDLNACGGTHVQALGQIGGLLLRDVERSKKTLRVSFVCGLRAVRSAQADFALLQAAARTLSTERAALPAAVERLRAEAKADAKERTRLREELASQHAVRLAVEEHITDGLRMVKRSFADRDAEYVRLLASRLIAATPQTAALLLSTLEEPATLVLASNLGESTPCGAWMREELATLGLRAGGSPELAQAQLPASEALAVMGRLTGRLRASAATAV